MGLHMTCIEIRLMIASIPNVGDIQNMLRIHVAVHCCIFLSGWDKGTIIKYHNRKP